MTPSTHAVTGAFSYSGRYIAARLLAAGHRVVTLTGSPHKPNPFGDQIQVYQLAFDDPDQLVRSLRGVQVLYNTYWVRFNHRAQFTHARAVENTRVLFAAARRAGVRRVVHVSITNPSEASPLEYFRDKAVLERGLVESGLSHAILRPTVLFGREDILINNIAWALRRFPVFAIFGDGSYRLQPIFVDDLAELAVCAGAGVANTVINAIGPETFTYRALVESIASAVGLKPRLLHVSPGGSYALARLIGWFVRDTFITREEIRGLMAGLLCVDAPPAGRTRLTGWLQENAASLGRHYASELARRNSPRQRSPVF